MPHKCNNNEYANKLILQDGTCIDCEQNFCLCELEMSTVKCAPVCGPRPKLLSKFESFSRSNNQETLDAILEPITRYDLTPEKLPTVIQMKESYDVDEKEVFYDGEEDGDSKIYKAYDKETGTYFLAKRYQLPDADDKIFYDRAAFLIEIYALMYHLNLLNYYGCYYDKDPEKHSLWMIMEPLEYTLKEYVEMRHGPNGEGINEFECKSIIADILDNLWTFHLSGSIHTDIKPTNIMFRDKKDDKPEENGWKLIDYDNRLTVLCNSHILLSGLSGTVQWTPPEVDPMSHLYILRGKDNYYSNQGDIWQIGLIILYILFGNHPYILDEKEDDKWNRNWYWYYTKVLKGGKYDMDSDKNKGSIALQNYLIGLYVEEKISKDLFDLLFNYILIFDPRKRASCKDVYNHKWFDDYRMSLKKN